MTKEAEQLKSLALKVAEIRPSAEMVARFPGLQGEIAGISDIVGEVASIDFERVAVPERRILVQTLNNIDSWFQTIRVFVPGRPEFAQSEQNLRQQLPGHYQDIVQKVWPIVSFHLWRTGGLREAAERQRSELEELRAAADKASIQIEEALDSARQIVAESAVSKTAGFFQSEAGLHQRQAAKWLIASVIMAGCTAAYAIWLFHVQPPALASSSVAAVQAITARIVLVSLLSYALIWCTRNYSAARHNEVVNRHRSNALSTFNAFIEAAKGDDGTKNAVLLETTRSIFAPQATGYGRSENEPQPGAQVVEVFRGLVNGNKP